MGGFDLLMKVENEFVVVSSPLEISSSKVQVPPGDSSPLCLRIDSPIESVWSGRRAEAWTSID